MRRGRLLDHFLVAPLQGAIALSERDHVTEPVAEDLDLDVARRDDEPLDEAHVVAEVPPASITGRWRLRRDRPDGRTVAFRCRRPRRGSEHDRVADLVGDIQRVREIAEPVASRQQRHSRRPRERRTRESLRPNASRFSGVGPIHVTTGAGQARAKPRFSDKKP